MVRGFQTIHSALIERGRLGTLPVMRALSIAMVAIYLCVGGSLCGTANAEKPAHAPHAETTAHAHAGGEAHGSMHHDADHHGDGMDAENKLRPRCSCGCGGGLAAANSFVRLGQGILTKVGEPAPRGSYRDIAVAIAEHTQAPLQAIDHVPISA
jgi:hypothetical protein